MLPAATKKLYVREIRGKVFKCRRLIKQYVDDLYKTNKAILKIEAWYESSTCKLFKRYHSLSARKPPVRCIGREKRRAWREDQAQWLEDLMTRIIVVSIFPLK